MTAVFDLGVVGGGSAGFAAAIRGAELGARVAMIEGGTLGGTCVNVGCVPSKTLIRAAEAQRHRVHHGFAGIPISNSRPDWGAVRAQKDELVASLRQAKYWDVLRAYEAITLFEQEASVTAGGNVSLDDGTELTVGKLIVATGASPWAAPIPGLAEAGYLDSASAMALERLPASLIVIGGSAVGLELAQTFARLGVEVSVLEALPRLVPAEDTDVAVALARYLTQEGLTIHTGVTIEGVERPHGAYAIRGAHVGGPLECRAEQLLVATGRRPNTGGLGLESAGVTLGDKGEIIVDEHLQTVNPRVYAAGDVAGDPMFVYVAAYGGATAAENALEGNTRRYDLAAVPRVTFTDPAAASVGLTEEQAAERGSPLVTTLPLEYVPRALAARDTRGLIKLVADRESRRLLGAHILAAEAGEMITEVVLAVRFHLTIDDLTSTLHPYLTLSEGIKLAAQTFDRDVVKLSCCAA